MRLEVITILFCTAIFFAAITGWCMNVYKLVKLDFASPYKSEVIRLIGLVPPVGAIVGYLTIGEEATK